MLQLYIYEEAYENATGQDYSQHTQSGRDLAWVGVLSMDAPYFIVSRLQPNAQRDWSYGEQVLGGNIAKYCSTIISLMAYNWLGRWCFSTTAVCYSLALWTFHMLTFHGEAHDCLESFLISVVYNVFITFLFTITLSLFPFHIWRNNTLAARWQFSCCLSKGHWCYKNTKDC